MGKALLVQGGGGGTSSDDLTAKKQQVLEGYTAVTNDSDDEAVNGEMKNLSQRATITHDSTNPTKVVLGDAAYTVINSDGKARAEIRYNGEEGFVAPNTLFAIDQGVMASAGGLTASKIAQGQTAFGIDGTYDSDANASATQLLSGYTAYVKGKKISGTIVDRGQYQYGSTGSGTLNGEKYIAINALPEGYYKSNGASWAPEARSKASNFGNAPAKYVKSGYRFTSTDGVNVAGTLTVQSAVNFSAAAKSHDTIRISWKNPSSGPWTGVRIQTSTSGYPGLSGGSRVYTGTGVNGSSAGGNNYVDITGLTYETTYYFTCTSYANFSTGDEWGTSNNVSATTTEWWDTNSSGSMNVWIDSKHLPKALNDIDGKFRLIACSKEGARAIAGSAYALNLIGKNNRACMFMNMSEYVPYYYDTIVNTLQNTGYFDKKNGFSELNSYYYSPYSGTTSYEDQIVYSVYPRGRQSTKNTSWESEATNDVGSIVVATKYQCGFNLDSYPSNSSFNGCGMSACLSETYNNSYYNLVFRSGLYGYGDSSSNPESSRLEKKDYNGGKQTITKNIVCFGACTFWNVINDRGRSNSSSVLWWGNLYRCK